MSRKEFKVSNVLLKLAMPTSSTLAAALTDALISYGHQATERAVNQNLHGA